jgi:DNA gyrase/topoisomerase IV subunit B
MGQRLVALRVGMCGLLRAPRVAKKIHESKVKNRGQRMKKKKKKRNSRERVAIASHRLPVRGKEVKSQDERLNSPSATVP